MFFPHESFTRCSKESYAMVGGGPWGCDFGQLEEQKKGVEGLECGEVGDGSGDSSSAAGNRRERGTTTWVPSCSSVVKSLEDWGLELASPEACVGDGDVLPSGVPAAAGARRKRRRIKSCKDRVEVENQRMTHIAVERNRRKQMNEYLSVLRSMIPPSYVQRGDQASVIGGAINFVKELEQLLQSQEAQKRLKQQQQQSLGSSSSFSSPFSGFFTFPQCSSSSASPAAGATVTDAYLPSSAAGDPAADSPAGAIADIEVTMVKRHANLKVLSRRGPKQLHRMVAGLQWLRLAVLHLNVTTVEDIALYSFSLKVEEDCQLSSVDEMAATVHQMLSKIEDEAGY